MRRPYSYSMGFAIDGFPMPDPSEFSGKVSALDASGDRDATGRLHRDMVATKIPLKIKCKTWDWEMIQRIVNRISGESFNFTFPNPVTMALTTMEAYAGDRDWNIVLTNYDGTYMGDLSFSVIPY